MQRTTKSLAKLREELSDFIAEENANTLTESKHEVAQRKCRNTKLWQELAIERKLLILLIDKFLEVTNGKCEKNISKSLENIYYLYEAILSILNINDYRLKEISASEVIELGDNTKEFLTKIDKLQNYFYSRIITDKNFDENQLDDLNSLSINVDGGVSKQICEKNWYKHTIPSNNKCYEYTNIFRHTILFCNNNFIDLAAHDWSISGWKKELIIDVEEDNKIKKQFSVLEKDGKQEEDDDLVQRFHRLTNN